ncbi:MAG: metalloprotease, partial [Bacteroidia bacterium]|nr:metalloprotease [Bacteroidia bacterium]
MKKLYLTILLCSLFVYAGHSQKTEITDYIQNHLEELKLVSNDADFNILSSATLTNKNYKVYYLQQVVHGYPLTNTHATVVIADGKIKSFKHNFVENVKAKVSHQTASITPVMAANYALNQLDLSNSSNVKVVNYASKKDIKKADVLASDLQAPLEISQNAEGEYVLTYEIIVKSKDHW